MEKHFPVSVSSDSRRPALVLVINSQGGGLASGQDSRIGVADGGGNGTITTKTLVQLGLSSVRHVWGEHRASNG